MERLFQSALASMSPKDVAFVLSSMPKIAVGSAEICLDGVMLHDPDDDSESRRRRHIDRVWPDLGTTLTAEYFGEQYRAEIVPASKRLKSGRQIRIESGPSRGAICDSFSEAMLQATEMQRASQNLGRKGVANGWVFWKWDGKPASITGDDEEEESHECEK